MKNNDDIQCNPNRMVKAACRRTGRPNRVQTVLPTVVARRRELREKQEQAIHRCFYRRAGVRFWAECLMIYARNHLEAETDAEALWAGSYNSCIDPMKRRLESLEKELAELEERYGGWPVVPSNNDLLLCMRRVLSSQRTDPLKEFEDRDVEVLRDLLWDYVDTLEREMLSVYPRDE